MRRLEGGGGGRYEGSALWQRHLKKKLASFGTGSGLALGFGDGGGVASERARVCGVLWCGTRGYHNLGQIQHICASLTPRVGIGAAMLDGQYFGVWRWYATIWGEFFFGFEC